MKIILSEKVMQLGDKGKVVNVKPGYARNFLFPKKKAVLANAENIKKFYEKKVLMEKKLESRIETLKNVKKKLDKIDKLKIFVKSGKEGKLFGSVNAKIITYNLRKIGVKVNKKSIYIKNNFIRKLGIYNVNLKLYKNIESNIYVEILSK
ncbi:50S ribosomal protein L9 [Buchnera aphidicola (Chaitoregma tattakana)]|uniref:50S ribosomal protein L9 n=1 Tax=Buchnera aphidicola TaxID=9 RepID=UPI0031B7F19A